PSRTSCGVPGCGIGGRSAGRDANRGRTAALTPPPFVIGPPGELKGAPRASPARRWSRRRLYDGNISALFVTAHGSHPGAHGERSCRFRASPYVRVPRFERAEVGALHATCRSHARQCRHVTYGLHASVTKISQNARDARRLISRIAKPTRRLR